MNFDKLIHDIVQDAKVDFTQEFDRNFERKGFFDKKWENTKHPNSRGSLMLRSGRLRRSLNSSGKKNTIQWRSNLPYASIHNEGGEIVITQKMKSFFWAMYYKAHNAANVYTVKTKRKVNTKRTRALSAEAQKWKAMALQPVGKKIKVEQRQFIGHHPILDKRLEKIVNNNMEIFNKQIKDKLE